MARILKNYPEVALNPADLDGRIDFANLFGRSSSVHIEIGCGRGSFLIGQAQAEPNVDFIGIEWASRYYRYSLDRIGRWGLSNVKLIRTDAAKFITDFIAAHSVDCFHIYFPDPWPKRHHHKRRFFNPANAEQLLRCLKPNGVIQLATDHANYFEQMQRVIAGFGERLEEIEFVCAAAAENGEKVGTNFERKYIKDKRGVHAIAVKNSTVKF